MNFDKFEIPESLTPVVVIQGRRCIEKSSFIVGLLKSSPNLSVGVITNESAAFLHAAVDAERVEGEFVPHAVGCLCCVSRSGLVDALRRLHVRRLAAGSRLDLVIVETAETSDPAPVLQTLMNNPLVTHYYRLSSVVQVMGAAQELPSVSLADQSAKQIALADRIVFVQDSRTSLTPELVNFVSAVNPSAQIFGTNEATLENLGGASARDEFSRAGNLDAWLCSGEEDVSVAGCNLFRFRARLPGNISWEAFHGWLGAALQSHGDVIYRLRALLSVEGETCPVFLQSAQHVIEPPSILESWGAMDPVTHLHFVTRNLHPDVVRSSLANDLPIFAASAAQREYRQQRALLDPSLPV